MVNNAGRCGFRFYGFGQFYIGFSIFALEISTTFCGFGIYYGFQFYYISAFGFW